MKQLKLRQVMGRVLRAERLATGQTLREVGMGAQISVGYLSEVERGQKEPSSEVLAAICNYFELPMSEFLLRLSEQFLAVELSEEQVCLAA